MTYIGQVAGHNVINREAKFTVERGGVLLLLQPVFLKKSERRNVEVRCTDNG